MNKTSRDILNEILSFKNVIEKLCPTCKLRGSNLIYRSDTLNALNIDVVDNRNIGGNCLNNSGLRLNSTGYGKLAIIFIQKMKNLSKNWWSLDSSCYSRNNEKVSHKITDFDKKNYGVKCIIVASPLRVKNQAMI